MQFAPIPSPELVEVSVIPSPHSFPNLIALADIKVITGPFGRILQQNERGKQYLLTKHCFDLQSPKTMHLTTNEPMLVLSYTLEGNMIMQHRLLGTLPHAANSSYLYYLPAGYHEVALPAGLCTTLKLHINLSLLEIACYAHPQLTPLLNRVREGCPDGWTMPLVQTRRESKTLLNQITQCLKKGGSRKLLIDRCIEELLEYYIARHDIQVKEGRTYTVPERHIESLRHAEQKLGIEGELKYTAKQAARKLGMTARQLSKACKHVFNHGWHSHQKKKKIEKACKLLLTTDKTIQEIAYEVYYDDPTSFNRAFREEKGCTPEEYRADKKED